MAAGCETTRVWVREDLAQSGRHAEG